MTVAKPSIVPHFADTATITTPPTNSQHHGWVFGDTADPNWLNYLFQPLTRWAQFWNEKISSYDGVTLVMDATSVTAITATNMNAQFNASAGAGTVSGAMNGGASQAHFTANVANTATILSSGPISTKAFYFQSAAQATETVEGVLKAANGGGSTGMLEPVLWTKSQAVFLNKILFRDHSLPNITLSASAQNLGGAYSYPANTARVGTLVRVRASFAYSTTGSVAAHNVTIRCNFGTGSNGSCIFPVPSAASTRTIVLDCEFTFYFSTLGGSANGSVHARGLGGIASTGAIILTTGDSSLGTFVASTLTAQPIQLQALTSSVTGVLQLANYYIESL